jgi:hypothetical protein
VRKWVVVATLAAAWAWLVVTTLQPPDFQDYRKTAVQAAEASHDALRTAALTVDASLAHHTFDTYLATMLDDCVGSASSALGQFNEEPPADERSAALRDEVAPLLAEAASRLGEVDRAAGAGDEARLRAAAEPLTPLGERLAEFLDRHG